jgi:hypothetical protein
VIAVSDEKLRRYSQRVGYTDKEIDLFRECNHRIRHIDRLSDAAPLYSIVAEVVEARHCNSGHHIGQRLVLDVDGNFITKLCPSRICVYLASQLTIPKERFMKLRPAGHAGCRQKAASLSIELGSHGIAYGNF